MSAVFIDESFSKDILDMDIVLKLVEESFSELNKGNAYNMERHRLRIPKGALHLLAGGVPYKGVLGFKAYTSFRSGLIFNIHLMSAETGEPLAILQGNYIGRMRTGASSGVATKYLGQKDSKHAVFFGSGAQTETQVRAIISSCKSIEKTTIISRDQQKGIDFAHKINSKYNIIAEYNSNVEEVLKTADIITTVTTSPKPLFKYEWLKKTAHINAVGSNALIRAEIPEKAIVKADILSVDDKNVAILEAGDLLSPLEKGRLNWRNIHELGDIINKKAPRRESDTDLTIFESQGMGLQDIIVAEYVYRKAIEQNKYTSLPF